MGMGFAGPKSCALGRVFEEDLAGVSVQLFEGDLVDAVSQLQADPGSEMAIPQDAQRQEKR